MALFTLRINIYLMLYAFILVLCVILLVGSYGRMRSHEQYKCAGCCNELGTTTKSRFVHLASERDPPNVAVLDQDSRGSLCSFEVSRNLEFSTRSHFRNVLLPGRVLLFSSSSTPRDLRSATDLAPSLSSSRR